LKELAGVAGYQVESREAERNLGEFQEWVDLWVEDLGEMPVALDLFIVADTEITPVLLFFELLLDDGRTRIQTIFRVIA
jgi:hypothetical protein